MNQKGFIPIIFVIVGAVVIASAAFGVVKYKDELSQVPAAVINFFTGPDEEQDFVEEPIIEATIEEILDKKAEKAIEKEEKKEEKKGKRIVKGPRTGPKEEKPEKQIEEIQEQQEQEVEVIETDVLTISDINVDINKVPTDPVVITWITNKESNTSLEYGLSPGSYDWLLHNDVSKETDAGFLHAIYLYVELNRVHHYRINSVDSDGNRAESENMSFRKIYFPFNVVCNYPDIPVVTSHTSGQSLDADTDTNQGMEGIQIELVGVAAPRGVVFTSLNSLYETPVDEVGDWEQKDVTLEQGKNEIYIKARNVLNCESDIILTLYLDSEFPITTIEITDRVDNDFTVNWSASEKDCIFDVEYKIKPAGGAWGDPIYPEWGSEVEQGSQFFDGAENESYKFKITATDPAGNVGDPTELEEPEI